MIPSTWALTSMPIPRSRTHTAVVVTAVTLMSRFKRMFLNASRRKNPKLDLIGVDPPHLVANDAPVFERYDPFAHHIHHLLVVGCHENRGTDAVDPVQELHDAHAGIRVEVSGRLVGDEYRRLGDEGAGDRNPLLFAARELIRVFFHLVAQAYEVQDLGHLRADSTPPLTCDLHR